MQIAKAETYRQESRNSKMVIVVGSESEKETKSSCQCSAAPMEHST